MHRIRSCLVILSIVAVSTVAQAQAQQTTAAAPSAQKADSALKALRVEMQTKRADLLAKNLTLTSDQAAKFWPVFNAYQKEQNAIIDEQLTSIQKYVDNADAMDDAGALAFMKAHLDRDAKMTALRLKWLAEFQKAVPTKLAVRAMQIDRRISMAIQAEIASYIPRVH